MSTTAVHFDARLRGGVPIRVTRVRPKESTDITFAARLTRRGRLVVLLLVFSLAFVAFTMVGSPAVSTDEPHHASSRQVVVEPGQTLWDIAAEVAPSQDPRGVIADIVDLNALVDAGSIRAGQPLYIPQY